MGPLGRAKFHANRWTVNGVGTRLRKLFFWKFPVFGKESSRTLWPISTILIRPTILQVFYVWIDSLHWLQSYCSDTARRVIHLEFFRAPCRKNYALDRKMIPPFWWAWHPLSPCKVWWTSITARRLQVGIMVFVCLFLVSSVTLRVLRACSRGTFLNKYCVAVYGMVWYTRV